MNGLLEVLLTFIGVVMVLALLSQSLIEVVKASFPIKGHTRKGSVQSLLEEAAKSTGFYPEDGRAIYEAVEERLEGLGQNGLRSVRLDRLTAEQLRKLICSLEGQGVPGFEECSDVSAKLKKIAERAKEWYPLAMDPVSCRYRRRMRITNVIAAAVVVIGLDASAFDVMNRALTDEAFRESVSREVADLDGLMTRTDSLEVAMMAGLAAGDASAADSAALAALEQRFDSLRERSQGILDNEVFAPPGLDRPWTSIEWWVGVLITILLVSLGAPFWHDLLGTVFGLKQRVRTGPQRDEGTTGGRGPPGDDPAARNEEEDDE